MTDATLTMRMIGVNDYNVFDDGQHIGRIRCANERTPSIWTWQVQVHIPGPPFGDARTIKKAKQEFKTAWLAFKAKHGPEALAKAYDIMKPRQSAPTVTLKKLNCGVSVMRLSPSIVPGSDRDIYMVLDDFGYRLGRAWPEMSEEDTDRDTLLRHLMEGQYSDPIRIVSFNTSEGWSQDASEEIAAELRQHCAERGEVPPSFEDFLDRHGRAVDIQLSLL
jgi:hypothetical protein